MAQVEGMAIGALYPKMLSPLPEEEIRAFAEPLKVVIVPEMNYLGQLAELLEARLDVPIVRLNKYSGLPFTAGEIYEQIRRIYKEAQGTVTVPARALSVGSVA